MIVVPCVLLRAKTEKGFLSEEHFHKIVPFLIYRDEATLGKGMATAVRIDNSYEQTIFVHTFRLTVLIQEAHLQDATEVNEGRRPRRHFLPRRGARLSPQYLWDPQPTHVAPVAATLLEGTDLPTFNSTITWGNLGWS